LTELQASRESASDANLKTVQLVRLISKIGPDIPEIARRLDQYKESVRYRYKNKLLAKVLAVQAIVDHEKLGLQRIILVVDFADELIPHAKEIALAMNELCYVVSYAKTVPDGHFLLNASVPREYVKGFMELFAELKRRGVFKSVESSTFESYRNIPMRAESYNFSMGRWDFDWSLPAKREAEAASYTPSPREKFDKIDLLILKEIHVDADRPLVEVARKLKTNYKMLAWHYANHVIRRPLIKGYRINWMGTRYDPRLDKVVHRKHSYIFLNVLVHDLSALQRMTLMSRLSELPFLWAEAVGKDYHAQIALPVDYVAEGLEFIQRALEPVRERAQCYIEDTSDAVAFTFSYQLYDGDSKKWLWNSQKVLDGFENLMMKIKEGAG